MGELRNLKLPHHSEMKALVIDDSKIMRRLLTHVSKFFDITTYHADKGQAVLNMLEHDDTIAFATVDWNMPRISGLEFVNRIRQQAKYYKLKIFVRTASDTSEVRDQAKLAGAHDLLLKTVSKFRKY